MSDEWEDRFAESAERNGLPAAYGLGAGAMESIAATEAYAVHRRVLARRIEEVSGLVKMTPIERPMWAALVVAGARYGGPCFVVRECPFAAYGGREYTDDWCPVADNTPPLHTLPSVELWIQRSVGKYRADFVVRCTHSEPARVGNSYEECLVSVEAVVECDGHDFHERTKEQARHDRKRDRFMQESGYLVLRYTGSEIWADPIGCALSAVSAAMDRAVAAARYEADRKEEEAGR